ncbi:SMI1/KNR4 family protein [Phycicoccus flavus]|uniref:SMI1/KNR4 family protein n=1 Tax=Phycicoccus flavus TaxID=2502783 RepID=UPI000FEB7CB9|nr:SMI1/KNR4 family protein [Phycicoccus flavus]NHA69912.1 SMI1/KNR4 family protein [Phycicoccus flavus]
MVDERIEPAVWGEPVDDDDLAEVEDSLKARIPPPWRAYLQDRRWLRHGWLESGDFLQCFDPRQALERLEAWEESADLHPGIYLLGGDGSRNLYCVDLRQENPAVGLTDMVSSGWHDVETLVANVESFVEAIRDGSFQAYPDS